MIPQRPRETDKYSNKSIQVKARKFKEIPKDQRSNLNQRWVPVDELVQGGQHGESLVRGGETAICNIII